MKFILSVVVLFLFSGMYSQTSSDKRELLYEKRDSEYKLDYEVEYVESIKDGETKKHIVFYFHNDKYSALRDYGGVYFFDQKALNPFIKDLESAFSQLKPDNDLFWKRDSYSLSVYSGRKSITVTNSKDEYCFMRGKSIQKVIDALKSRVDKLPVEYK